MIMHDLHHQQMIVQRRLEQVLIAFFAVCALISPCLVQFWSDGSCSFEVGLAVWMIQIYQHHGVWAMGKKN